MFTKMPPRMDHQEQTYNQLLQHDEFIDFSDPGTGKTRSLVDAIAEHMKNGAKAALVLAPKSLVDTTWVNEVEKWQPHLRVVSCFAHNRAKQFAEEADIYVTNIDAATWLAKQPPDFFDRFDILAIDELSNFKNHKAQRTKAMLQISAYFKYRYGLTGTPLPNTLGDIWSQVAIIDRGETLGGSFYQFRNQVCTPVQVGAHMHAKRWDAKPGAKEAVAGLLSSISIRHDFSLLNLPENFINVVKYKMSKKSRQQYEQLKKAGITQVGTDFLMGVNAAALLQKLLQACAGTAYNEAQKVLTLDSQRAELIVDLVDAREHSVVFFQWKHQRDAILEQLKKKKLPVAVIDGETSSKKREAYVRDFQAGKYRALLAHPAAAAHGLTLTRATTTIWASLTYNLEYYLQGNRRIHRKGQTKKTETIVVMAEDTVESKVMKRLNEKNATQQGILDVLAEL